MSEVCEKESDNTYSNETDRMKDNFIRTGITVQNETTMGNIGNTNTVNDSVKVREYAVEGNDNIPEALLLCLPVSTEEGEKMNSNSISDIAKDVEFIDNFDFNSTDVDELEDHVGFD